MNAAFTVKQEKFEGPLDLLLTLIERRQLHVSDVALSKVTDDFLGYIQNFSEFPLAESAQFAFIASTLLLIKSRALLPTLSLTPEEEASVEELQLRLKMLERFRDLARHVKNAYAKQPMFLPLERKMEPTFAPPETMSLATLADAMKSVLAALPKMEKLSKAAVRKVMSLEEMIVSLTERVKRSLRMNFTEFSKMHRGERVTVIVGFLAMLELVKQGIIAVTQDDAFGEIVMETESVEVPRY